MRALSDLLESESWVERVLAAETIARISRPATGWNEDTSNAVARGLLNCAVHAHWWVRRSALFCCGRLRLHSVALQLLPVRLQKPFRMNQSFPHVHDVILTYWYDRAR